jgi:hypothetical protein
LFGFGPGDFGIASAIDDDQCLQLRALVAGGFEMIAKLRLRDDRSGA